MTRTLTTIIITTVFTSLAVAVPPPPPGNPFPSTVEIKKPQLERLAKKLSGCVFEGSFTTDGRKGAPRAERYEISKAAPVGNGPKWIIAAKIQYAKRAAITVPVPVQILWAGNTPVITLSKTTIPGMGTFSARVVIHGDRYAGTWQHDDKGGHLFGKIVKPKK